MKGSSQQHGGTDKTAQPASSALARRAGWQAGGRLAHGFPAGCAAAARASTAVCMSV